MMYSASCIVFSVSYLVYLSMSSSYLFITPHPYSVLPVSGSSWSKTRLSTRPAPTFVFRAVRWSARGT
nr:MAG TPA: hypothetical protein [Bacteriophage sp.]